MTNIYAEPRVITDLGQCSFYHTMDIPGFGLVEGLWDLRQREHQYFGNVDFGGKRVLEVGTASGHLCFWLEQQGAEVVAYDLSPNQGWDIIPFARYDHQAHAAYWRNHIGPLNNSYWLTHHAMNSKAKVVYGSVYEIPQEIGPVDIATFGSILLHVRDPFQALYKASLMTRERIIVTELKPPRWLFQRAMYFRPEAKTTEPKETWWWLPPKLIVAFLGVLGFEDSTVTYHRQLCLGRKIHLYTVVGQRTTPFKLQA